MGCDDNCHRLNGVLLCFNQTPPASMPAEARLESVSVPVEKSKSLYLLCISFCTTVLAQKKDAKKTAHLGKKFEPFLGDLLGKKRNCQKKCQEKTRFEPGDQEMPKPVNAAVLEKSFKKNTTFGVNFKACAANAVSDAKAVSLRAFYSFHNRRNTRSFESSQDGKNQS